MPLLSAFSPCGMLAMSSKPTHAERFYRAMVESTRGPDGKTVYDFSEGSRMDGFCYASAMAMARARYLLEHAGHEIQTTHVTECLAKREDEYGVVPTDGDLVSERRAVLTARRLLPSGAAQTNVENALAALLPDDFLAYLPTPLDTEVVSPTTINASPMNLQRADVPNQLFRLVDAVTGAMPASYTVRIDALDPATSTTTESGYTVTSLRPAVGDKIVVSANAVDMAERVTITAVGILAGSPAYRTITATFTKPHVADAVCVVGDWPYWHSTKRLSLVVLTIAAAEDAEKRRKVNDQMQRQARGVSRWQIAGGLAGSAGPFKVGVGQLGVTPLGTVAF